MITIKPYMLITVIGRDIFTEQFITFKEAHDKMMEEFCTCANINIKDCTEEESECDGEFGYCKDNAYISKDFNRGDGSDWQEDCDWKIAQIY